MAQKNAIILGSILSLIVVICIMASGPNESDFCKNAKTSYETCRQAFH